MTIPATPCLSTYTVNRRTGETLRCSGQHLRGNPFRQGGDAVHVAEAYGLTWTWYDDEADQ